MNNTFFIFVFLFLGINSSFAQMVDNAPQEVSLGVRQFNSNFIKHNKIKSITIDIVDKPDGNTIVDKGETNVYEFNEKGDVTRYYYTVLSNTATDEVNLPAITRKGKVIRPAGTKTQTRYLNDTIFVNVYYDSLRNIILKRVANKDYYDAYYYEYHQNRRVKKITHCKETNINENKKIFKLGVQKILSVESYEYKQLTPTQLKKTCLNDEGREYKIGIINFDLRGNKITENYGFVVSWMREERLWEYDAQGRLTKNCYVGNESGETSECSVFEYNNTNDILTELRFKNSVLVKEINYLYDETSRIIKSEANRDFINTSIDMVKYYYTYYP